MDVCRICSHDKDHEEFTADERMFALGESFVYFQCAKCRCLQIRDIPTDMTRYYPEHYYSMQVELPHSNGRLSDLRLAVESRLRLKVNNRLFGSSRRTRIFDWMRGTRTNYDSAILDVGCGRGKLLHELRLLGFKNLTGADPFVAKDLLSDGVRIYKRQLAELEGHFDLIMMHHTFEHLPEPEANLAAAAERLRPGGFLLLRVPLVDCFAWRKYGVHWLSLDAPRHFFLHTEKSIGLLAQRTGFSVEDVVYDSGAHQFWGSEQYLRDIPHRSPTSYEGNPAGSIFTRQQIRQFEQQSRELNAKRDGDAACFYLRRQDTRPK